MTYGAGGSTRERTHDLIVRIQRETDLTAVSHLTCVCHTLGELEAIFDRYAASGIENVLALRGDPPRDKPNYDRAQDAFAYAEGLVQFIKSRADAGDRVASGSASPGPEREPRLPEPVQGDG